jgi:hypothetical protein
MPAARKYALILGAASLGLVACGAGQSPKAPASIYFAERIGAPFAPWQLMVMTESGVDVRQLTSASTADNDEPDVSPDGTLVAFASKRDFPAPPPGEAQNPTLRLIYLMKADGSGPRRLTTNAPELCSEHTPRFAPDGLWIVFAMACDDVHPIGISRLYRIRIDGSGQEPLVPVHADLDREGNWVSPAFDSSGGRVLFAGELAGRTSSFDLFSLGLTDSSVQRLTRCVDGGRSVIVRNRLSVFGGAAYFVSGDYVTYNQPAAFESVDVGGSRPQQRLLEIPVLTSPESLSGVPRDFELALSPQGDRLAFVSYDDVTTDPPTQAIAVSAQDGSGRVKLRAGGQYSGPTWH